MNLGGGLTGVGSSMKIYGEKKFAQDTGEEWALPFSHIPPAPEFILSLTQTRKCAAPRPRPDILYPST